MAWGFIINISYKISFQKCFLFTLHYNQTDGNKR